MAFKFLGFIILFGLIIFFCYVIRLVIDIISDLLSIRKLNKDLKKLESHIERSDDFEYKN